MASGEESEDSIEPGADYPLWMERSAQDRSAPSSVQVRFDMDPIDAVRPAVYQLMCKVVPGENDPSVPAYQFMPGRQGSGTIDLFEKR